MKPRVLLIEDDKSIVENLSVFLAEEGFTVTEAGGRREALQRLSEQAFDLVLLDISLPDGNGFSLCMMIRQEYKKLPIIFLTAQEDEYSVVAGLDMGASDYVTKPFRPRELVSRMRNVLRQTQADRSVQMLCLGDVQVDPERARVTKAGKEIFLSALEYRLLLSLIAHKGMVISRDHLLEEIWDAAGEFVNDNTLTVYIKRLREKIEENPQQPRLICTVRGLGYQIGAETDDR